jgi:hypothetical protein
VWPRLHLVSVALHGGRVVADGTVAAAAEVASVRVSVTARGVTSHLTAPVTAGRFRVSYGLGGGQRGAASAAVAVAVPQSPTVLPERVRLIAAPHPSRLRLISLRLHDGRLTASGSVAAGARGRVTLTIADIASTGPVTQALAFTIGVRVRGGRWRLLNARMPGSRTRRVSIVYSGDGRRGIAGAQLVRTVHAR